MTEIFYIDSNIFIFPIIYENEQANISRKILERIEKNEIIAYTSVLTWDEVAYVVNKVMGKADSINAGKKFINYPNLRFIQASIDIIIRAQEIIQNYNLKPRDSIHVASALSKSIHNIVSDDSDFDKIDLIKRVVL